MLLNIDFSFKSGGGSEGVVNSPAYNKFHFQNQIGGGFLRNFNNFQILGIRIKYYNCIINIQADNKI